MQRSSSIIVVSVLLCLTPSLQCESALQQLYDAGGPPPNVPMPQTPSGYYQNSAPSSQSVPKSAPMKSYHAPSTSAVVGATIFGALLENMLFDSPSNTPDPETIRKQQEQERQAQEEAKRQAIEAQKHHQTLMRSFKSIPSTTTTTEATASSLSFKTTQSLEASKIDTSSDEAMRESASKPFDGGTSHTALPNSWKPYALTKTPIAFSKPTPLCHNTQCLWPKASSINTQLPQASIRHTPVSLATLGIPSGPNLQGFLNHIIVPQENRPEKFYVIVNQLNYLGKEVGKELLTSIAMKLLESTPIGQKIALVKDVHELALNDMEDANKVALWLGSRQIDTPPEITSLSQSAKPFLIRGIGASESFEKLSDLISDTNDVFDMSAKFSDILKKMP